MQEIISSQNQKIKLLKSLASGKGRKESGLYLIEGATIVKDIPSDKVNVVSCFLKDTAVDKLFEIADKLNVEMYSVKDTVFDGAATTVTPSGIIAVAKLPTARPLSTDKVLLLCGISDAGNLGTIFRTAAARGVVDVICVDCADAFSPKTVRSSMGGIFYINVITADMEEAYNLLDGYKVIALDCGGKSIYGYKTEGKFAIAVGNEAHGLPKFVRENSDEILSLPMKESTVESLNAAVSISVAMYFLI